MMKNNSLTYRFLSAFTALILLLSLSTPAILHAAGFGGCTMNMEIAGHEDHPSSEISESEHCEKVTHHEAKRDESESSSESSEEDCAWNFNCGCSIDKAAANANAVPALSKISAGFTPSVIQTLDFSLQTNTVKPTEIFVALYSPPLFLQNSSFLN